MTDPTSPQEEIKFDKGKLNQTTDQKVAGLRAEISLHSPPRLGHARYIPRGCAQHPAGAAMHTAT